MFAPLTWMNHTDTVSLAEILSGLSHALDLTEREGSLVAKVRKLASLAVSGRHGARNCSRSGVRGARRLPAASAAAMPSARLSDMDEHWDGGGHPRGLAGGEIAVLARIMGVAAYAATLGERLGLAPADILRFRRAGMVHDLGKLTVPHSILESPHALSEEEWGIVRRHPAYTFEVLSQVPILDELALDAASHHERVDGRGYHRGISGDEMSLAARILAVADVMDALAADRPYRAGMAPERVMGILTEESGAHFCPTCVDACSIDMVTLPASGVH